ncbi:hypothetical protein FOA43_001192 [Brettanomyces nanus]|uniref:Uncharacterized protein n=1 Tax=Eeniella nana TaxID=13502 RepID=A0A875RTV0_EENNA|nr:uncharacterized protein FOA43_001192 [Brettanomyces nanus]QPG73877.1 hypothetical protein FOA43_001192 [Brettanomyces nanus]
MEEYPTHSLSVSLAPFIQYIEGPLLITCAHFDLAVVPLLAKECYNRSTLYPLIFYLFIWGLRVEYSDASRIAISNLIILCNSVILHQAIPQTIQDRWVNTREKFAEMFSLDICLATKSKQSNIGVVEGKESVPIK